MLPKGKVQSTIILNYSDRSGYKVPVKMAVPKLRKEEKNSLRIILDIPFSLAVSFNLQKSQERIGKRAKKMLKIVKLNFVFHRVRRSGGCCPKGERYPGIRRNKSGI